MLTSPKINSPKQELERVLATLPKPLTQNPAHRAIAEAVVSCSPFLTKALVAEAPFLVDFLAHKAGYPLPPKKPNRSRQQLMADLRQARLRLALVVGWQELVGASLEETTKALSNFADEAVSQAVDFLLATHLPKLADVPYSILAVGKLGALELNYSSDIDLMAFYETSPAINAETAARVFPLITSELLTILSARTPQGYVFRTDLRLRPDPLSMPSAISLAAAEVYYETVGQNWERAALIKARPIAGSPKVGAGFLKLIEPFIWRRSLDFAAIDDILSIRRQSMSAHSKPAGDLNIKLDSGGIRDIEFFVQTRQLIWGGRQTELRLAPTLKVLDALQRADQLTKPHTEKLAANYRFLRHTENRLQMLQDQQTHSIPTSEDAKHKLAIFCGFEDTASFQKALGEVIATTQEILNGFYAPPKPLGGKGRLTFTATEPEPQTLATLAKMGFEDPTQVWHTVSGWHFGRTRAMRSERARQLLTELTPSLLDAFAATASPNKALEGFHQFLGGLPAGVAIFSLLSANPNLIRLLAEVLGSAPRQAKRLTRNPAMLEGLLRAEFYLPIHSKQELAAELAQEFAISKEEPPITIRRWLKDKKFQLAVQLLTNQNNAFDASPHYTNLAEIALAKEYEIISDEFEKSYARHPKTKKPANGELAVLALGKFGAGRLSGASDLDLIFVYNNKPSATNPEIYFNRLAQRIEGGLMAKTAEGELYTVDTRLRPSGQYGSPASSLEDFVAYHKTTAEFWERMALSKARVVVASPKFKKELEKTLTAILAKPEDPKELAPKLIALRKRIQKEHWNPKTVWKIKHMEGGLLDLDLFIQFFQRCEPSLTTQDPIKALELLVSHNKISRRDGEALVFGYKLWFKLDGLIRLSLKDETSPFGRGLQQKLARTAEVDSFAQLESLMKTERAKIAAIITKALEAP